VTDPDLRDPSLDRAYRETPRDEPPPELDERIRAAARRAVGTRPQSLEQQAADARRRSWTSRWRLPLSVAATVVIAATLTVMMQEEERRPRDDAGRGVSPMKVEPAREAERPAPPPASAPDAARSAPAAPPAAPAPQSRELESARQPAAARPEPAVQPKREERALEAQQPATAVSAPPVPTEQLEKRQQAPAPAAAPPPAAPPPIPAQGPALKAMPQTAPAGAASDALRRDRNLGDRPDRAGREGALSAVRTPEAWVEHIRTLRAQGREAEATAELAELGRAYPDFQLPPDLRGPR
jgi:hypothetical protein